MADFTPAPLKIGENEDGEAVVFRDINNPVLGIAVCHYHGINSNKKTMWANARLFAAAPEMYEALKWLMHLAHGVSKGGDCPVTDEEWRDAQDSAMKAIAKAEGGGSDGWL